MTDITVTDSFGQNVKVGDQVVYQSGIRLTLAKVTRINAGVHEHGAWSTVWVVPIDYKKNGGAWWHNGERHLTHFVKVTLATKDAPAQ